MKKNYKLFLLMTFITLFCLYGCKKISDSVAILKFATHPALDELENGFINTLNDALESKTIVGINIEKQNANGSPSAAKSLAEVISRKDVKLILAIATPAAQAVSRTPSGIPFIYGAVADPKGAEIINKDGTSDRATGIQNVGYDIVYRAIEFIKIAFPDKKKIGSLYNPSEQNSVYVQTLIKRACEEHKLEFFQQEVKNASEATSITQVFASRVDIIYSANDNTINSAVASVVGVCNSLKIPFILGDLSTLKKGAFAAIGLEYYSMGVDLGNIAIQILSGVKSIKDFPPQGPPKPEIWINTDLRQLISRSYSI